MNTRLLSFLAVYTLSVAVLIGLEVLRMPYWGCIGISTAVSLAGMMLRDRWVPRRRPDLLTARLGTTPADVRATALLRDLAGDEWPDAQRRGYLVVKSDTLLREYRIPLRPGMIEWYEMGEHVADLCAGLAGDEDEYPLADRVAARWLWLTGDEAGFLKVANRFGIPRRPQPDEPEARVADPHPPRWLSNQSPTAVHEVAPGLWRHEYDAAARLRDALARRGLETFDSESED